MIELAPYGKGKGGSRRGRRRRRRRCNNTLLY